MFFFKNCKLFLCFSNGHCAELLEVLHESKSGLACTCTSCLVALNELSFSVHLEISDFSIDFFNKLFHFFEI